MVWHLHYYLLPQDLTHFVINPATKFVLQITPSKTNTLYAPSDDVDHNKIN